MASGFGRRIILLLDWCWPFPLGIFASILALVIAAGIWMAVRAPQAPFPGRPLGRANSTEIPAQIPNTLPSPAQVAAPPVPPPTMAPRPSSRPTPSAEALPAARTALAKPRVAQPKVQLPPPAPRLSAAQQAEITDRLTIGRFLMDRKDYSAAIKEFQAALAVDPASREAKAAIQQAREADAQSKSISVP